MRAEERWPNKPMVPTAITSLIEYVPGSLRQHIGEPFGSVRRATSDVRKSTNRANEPRSSDNEATSRGVAGHHSVEE